MRSNIYKFDLSIEGVESDTTTSYPDPSVERLPWICLPAHFGDKQKGPRLPSK